MLMNHHPILFGTFPRMIKELVQNFAIHADEADVVQPCARHQHMLFLRGQIVGLGHLPADLDHGFGARPEQRVKGVDDAMAQPEGVLEIFRERVVRLIELFLLEGQLRDVLAQLAVRRLQL